MGSRGPSTVYAALGDPTRCGIVARLVRGEATVAELRRPLAMSAPAVSKHLRVLEEAGLVERRRVGRHQLCRLRAEQLRRAQKWLDEQLAFWENTIDSLVAHVEREQRSRR